MSHPPADLKAISCLKNPPPLLHLRILTNVLNQAMQLRCPAFPVPCQALVTSKRFQASTNAHALAAWTKLQLIR